MLANLFVDKSTNNMIEYPEYNRAVSLVLDLTRNNSITPTSNDDECPRDSGLHLAAPLAHEFCHLH